jgi:hypothetical protein
MPPSARFLKFHALKVVSMDNDPDFAHITDPNAILERALIDEFMFSHGQDPARLHELSADQRLRLLSAALKHAAARLAEMEARAHFVHELHGDR